MFRPEGIYPALLTPFDENQRINEAEPAQERARDHEDFERAMRRKLEREVGRAIVRLDR